MRRIAVRRSFSKPQETPLQSRPTRMGNSDSSPAASKPATAPAVKQPPPAPKPAAAAAAAPAAPNPPPKPSVKTLKRAKKPAVDMAVTPLSSVQGATASTIEVEFHDARWRRADKATRDAVASALSGKKIPRKVSFSRGTFKYSLDLGTLVATNKSTGVMRGYRIRRSDTVLSVCGASDLPAPPGSTKRPSSPPAQEAKLEATLKNKNGNMRFQFFDAGWKEMDPAMSNALLEAARAAPAAPPTSFKVTQGTHKYTCNLKALTQKNDKYGTVRALRIVIIGTLVASCGDPNMPAPPAGTKCQAPITSAAGLYVARDVQPCLEYAEGGVWRRGDNDFAKKLWQQGVTSPISDFKVKRGDQQYLVDLTACWYKNIKYGTTRGFRWVLPDGTVLASCGMTWMASPPASTILPPSCCLENGKTEGVVDPRFGSTNIVKALRLSAESNEYKTVVNDFNSTAKSFKVSNVWKITNRFREKGFETRREQIQMQNLEAGGELQSENERSMWHGSSYAAVKSIVANGFNRSLCGKKGVAYGKGSYFAQNASYSVKDYTPVHEGKMYVTRCRVLVGMTTLGTSDMVEPPARKDNPEFRFDSTSDRNGTVVVVYKDDQAIVDYVVEFA